MTNKRFDMQFRTRFQLIAVMVFALVVPGAAETADHSETKKTVVITGANRGLGLEFARQYAKAGWSVIGTARKPEKAADLKALGVRVMQLDVADASSVGRLASSLEKHPIDLLINNAGMANRDATFPGLNFDSVEHVLAVNSIGPMRVTQALLPNLQLGSTKKIVSISSDLGSIERNTGGSFWGYRESKAALNMFTRSLAAQLGDQGFICIVMSPGWVRTDMGGPEAPLSAAESISGMRAVIDGLKPEDSGSFQKYDGTTVPW